MKLDIYLIIGLTKESRHWSAEFLDALKSKFNPHSIQAVDLPGSGKLLDQTSPMSIESIVDQARSQLVFYPGHQRLVIAVSLGGMSAWSWVTQHEEDFTHMVMINSSLGSLSPFWKRVRPKAILQFFKIAFSSKGKAKETRVLRLCSNNVEKAASVFDSWVTISNEASMSLGNTIRQVIAGMNFKPKSAPKIPLLVIAAKHDQLAHFSCSQAIAKHASAKLVISDDPGIGHAFHVDAPEVLAQTIQGWVAEFNLG